MAFMLEHLVKEQIISVHTFGVMSQQEFIRLAEEAFALGARFGIDRYLVNHLDMTSDVDTLALFDLPKIHEQLGMNGSVKVASIYSAESLNKDDFDLYQIRAWSQGIHNIRHFTDPDQAMNWLLG